MAAITTSGTGASLFAYDVKFGPDGNIYVSDLNSNTILRYNGTTLAYMGVFAVPPAISSISTAQPQGLAFGPNGNLYAVCTVNDLPYGIYNSEFDGSTGTPISISTFSPIVNGGDLSFGRDGFIYVPEDGVLNRYNPTTGFLEGVFATDSRIRGDGFIIFGGPAPIDVVNLAPYGVLSIHTIRLTVVEGPVPVPPGVPVEVSLGFAGPEDHSVGPTQTVTLSPAQTASLDLDVSTVLSSGRLELRPVVTIPAGAPAGGTIEASVEVFDTANGIGSVFGRGFHSITSAPVFVPQGVPYGQNIRIIALAPTDSPCDALLSFADLNGNPVGPTKNANLQPGNYDAGFQCEFP